MKCASEDKLKTNFLRVPIWSDQIKRFGQHRFRSNDVAGPFLQLGNALIVQLRVSVHEGHEWLYVISGRLRLVLGDRDFVAEPGEAVEFSTWTPHWFGAVDEPVELIAIFGPSGERIHLHA